MENIIILVWNFSVRGRSILLDSRRSMGRGSDLQYSMTESVKEDAYKYVPRFVSQPFSTNQKKINALMSEAKAKFSEEKPQPLKTSMDDAIQLAKEALVQLREIGPFLTAARKHLQG